MFIYTLILIPIITTIICFIYFKKQVVWWEYLLIFGVTIVCIVSSKLIIEHTQVSDIEYRGGWIEEARFYEEWDEYIEQTCSQSCCCDSKGNNCSTIYYDCSYVDYHDEYYIITNSNDQIFYINRYEFNNIVSKFGTRLEFVDMHRDYHLNDGDMYKVKWNGLEKTLIPTISSHRYENRVRVSSSTFAMKEPPIEIFNEYQLFHYPKIYDVYKQKSILGYDDSSAEEQLQITNALLGKEYEFKSYIMIFKNQPREAGLYQEEQWQGGNKNELNLTIGIDDDENILWCHVFSWTDERTIVVNMRSFVEEQNKLDLKTIINKLKVEVEKNWIRKEFSSFNYLTVEPKIKHIIISFILTLIINIGVVYFTIINEYEE